MNLDKNWYLTIVVIFLLYPIKSSSFILILEQTVADSLGQIESVGGGYHDAHSDILFDITGLHQDHIWDENAMSVLSRVDSTVLRFSGYLKNDIFYDTRQIVYAREGLVSLYPKDIELDDSNRDIYAQGSLNMLAIHSRLKCDISGPSFLGAKTGSVLEVDFYGNENKYFSDLNGVRLFTGYMKLNWERTEVRVGQDWHPMSIFGYFPEVVSFSAGAPFHPMSRNPQISMRRNFSNISLTGSFLFQRDFTSTGPNGPSSEYLRNSRLPNLHIRLEKLKDSLPISGGIGIDYKKLQPRLYYESEDRVQIKMNDQLSGFSITSFLELRTKKVLFKTQQVYGQNAYDLLLIGGYGEYKIAGKDEMKIGYQNLNTVATWLDIQTANKNLNTGVFLGYTNLFGGDKIDRIYARGENIKRVFRIAPRVSYTIGAVQLLLEGENTTAYYNNIYATEVEDAKTYRPVTNFRLLLSMKYSFEI